MNECVSTKLKTKAFKTHTHTRMCTRAHIKDFVTKGNKMNEWNTKGKDWRAAEGWECILHFLDEAKIKGQSLKSLSLVNLSKLKINSHFARCLPLKFNFCVGSHKLKNIEIRNLIGNWILKAYLKKKASSLKCQMTK